MRPPREDIGAPELGAELRWIGGGPPGSMAELAASGPVLVHFFDFAQLNSVRTLPYLREWHARYEPHGLTTLLIQAPRFEFGGDTAATAAAADRLDLRMPVAIDSFRTLWSDYGCEGWPSLFLWGRGGALRWFHFSEGEYTATEEAIQEELRSSDALAPLPEPMEPVRATDAPGATVIAPTPELMPAGDRPWGGDRDDPRLTVEYEAGGAHVTATGQGRISIELDRESSAPVEIGGPGLYTLAEHDAHGRHVVELELEPGIELWTVSFSAGAPTP